MKNLIKQLLFTIAIGLFTTISFAQTYNLNDGNLGTITTCSGTFRDKSNKYSASQNNEVTFCSGSAAQMLINFDWVDLESGWDYIDVYDGNSTAATYMGNITGVLGAFSVQSSGSCITFVFVSDGSTQDQGWTSTVSCVLPCVDPVPNGVATNQASPIKVCLGESIDFSGAGSTAGAGFTIASYTWGFDDGNTDTGVTTSHSYADAGEYVVQLDLLDDNGCPNTQILDLVVQVGTEPTFVGTTADQTVCPGETTCLDGFVNPTNWPELPATIVAGETGLPDGSGVCYDAALDFTTFPAGTIIDAASDVVNIVANIEHTWAGDLTLTLECPNGQEVGLFNSDGTWNTTNISSEDFGDPTVPIGYDYTWTDAGQTMDAWSAANPNITIAAGSYASEETFAGLVGCPLNGTWELKICDTHTVDDGTVYSWGITFDPSVYSNLPGFEPTFGNACSDTYWSGNNGASTAVISSTSGDCDQICVTPPASGSYDFTYSATDDFGCTFDTVITVVASPGTVADAGNDIEYCSGQSGTIGVASVAGVSYLWSPTTGLSSSTNSNPTVSLANATGSPVSTVFTVTATLGSCTSIDQVTVTVNPQPTADAGNGGSICAGESFVIGNDPVGEEGFDYIWDNGAGNGTIDLTGGGQDHGIVTVTPGATTTYTLTVTSGVCIATDQATVTIDAFPIFTVSVTDVSCFGLNDGIASVIIDGSSVAISGYTWSDGVDNNNQISDPKAPSTTHAVTATAAIGGCKTVMPFTITEPPVLTVTASSTSVTCAGADDGTITFSAGGGTPTLVYSWTGGLTGNSTISGVADGTYTLNVTDGNSCVTTTSVTIDEPDQIIPTASATSVTCNSGSNGTVNSSAIGGDGNYTYTWSTLGAGQNQTGVSEGTYTVSITDGNGCTTTTTATVIEPTPLTLSTTGTSVTCNGASTGTANAVPGDGTAPYSYLWSPSGGGAIGATNLSAGTYTVSMSDANTCSITATYAVLEATPITVTAVSTSVTCNGTSNGTATATGIGGTGVITYSWDASTNLQTGITANTLGVGTYGVTATDVNGCKENTTVTVIEPTALQVTATSTDPLCAGANTGTGTAGGSGGTGALTYNWSSGATGTSVTGLADGIYTVSMSDVNGCVTTTDVTLVDPLPIIPTASATSVTCNGGSNGTVNTSATGGDSNYTYTWSTLGAGQNQTGVSEGTYTISITDGNGCITTTTATVIEPTPITVTTSGVSVTCNGANTGSATAVGIGGEAPITFSWSSGSVNASATGLVAGIYIVTGTDANTCSTTTTFEVLEPTATSVTASSNPASCNGISDGDVTATPLGGIAPFTYSWDGGANFQTIATATGLAQGNYTITVYDVNSCPATTTISITEPTALTLTMSKVDATCGANDGTANVLVTGGTGPYTYNWNTTETTAAIGGLGAATYTLTVTDFALCTSINNIGVNNAAAPSITITGNTSVTCNGGSNGTIVAAVSGGTPNYDWAWSEGTAINGASAITTYALTGLYAGTYALTITDQTPCIAVISVDIIEPAALIASINTSLNPLCYGGTTGTATVSAAGGISTVYIYNWSNGDATATASGLLAGTDYVVTITDVNSCTITDNITLTEPTQITTTVSVSATDCNGSNDGVVDLTVIGGTPIYLYNWSNSAGTPDLNGVVADTYDVTITDANGCITMTQGIVAEPSGITPTATATDSNCGQPDGTVSITAAGGTTGYNYTWSTTATTASVTGLTQGTYGVTIEDGNGCTTTTSATINDITGGTFTLTATDATCNGASDGSIATTMIGGSTPFTYNWTNSETTSSIGSIIAGNYTVTLTDGVGCQSTLPAVVGEPTLIVVNIQSTTDVLCNSGTTGASTIAVVGGTTGYTYSWTGGTTTQNLSNVIAGVYTVTVTDQATCTETATTTITEPDAITTTVSVSATDCNGGNNGIVDLTVMGGTPIYVYNWSNSAGTPDLNGVVADTYDVTITDGNGCIATTQGVVAEPTILDVAVACTGYTAPNADDGTIGVTVLGGTTAYTYQWYLGSMSGTVTAIAGATTTGMNNLVVGTYSVSVVDTNGCSDVSECAVTSLPCTVTSANSQTEVSCLGGSNGSFTAEIIGAVSPYTYTWSTVGAVANNNTTATLTGLIAGGYTVNIVDANGCQLNEAVTITEPLTAVTATLASTDVSCAGFGDGTLSVTATDGTGPYTYNWENSVPTVFSTAAVPAPVGGDTYTVTVTDVNLCTTILTGTVTEPTALSITAAITSITCAGASNGTGNITVTGGTIAYTYAWSNGATTTNLSGLAQGTYDVTATDNNTCTIETSIAIDEPTVLVTTVTVVDANCGNADGSASIVVTGGDGNYTYIWGQGGTVLAVANSTTGLTSQIAGTYNITVTDGNGCGEVTFGIINNNGAGVVSITNVVDVSCNLGSNGQATATLVGGAGVSTYSWSASAGSQVTSTGTGLPAGTHTIAITDNVGCIASASVTITEPTALSITVGGTNPICPSSCDGKGNVTVTGGTTNYNYEWSISDNPGVVINATNLVGGLCASGLTNKYYISITDGQGCDLLDSLRLANPPVMTVTTDNNPSSCGQSDGEAIITAINGGGVAGYDFLWGNGQTTASAIGLPQGIYNVTVTNQTTLCTYATSVSFNDLNGPSITGVSMTSVTCNGESNGAVNVTVTGGATDYTYAWYLSTDLVTPLGSTTTTLSGVPVGSYITSVTDANGCAAVTTNAVIEPSVVTVSLSMVSVTTPGGSDGSVTVVGSGGISPYTYNWENQDTPGVSLGTTAGLSGLSFGTYCVTTSDVNNCPTNACILVLSPGEIIPILNVTPALCNGSSDGMLNIQSAGGVTPHTYEWFDAGTAGSVGAGTPLTGLPSGIYYAVVTDQNSYTKQTNNITITEPTAVQVTVTSQQEVSCNGLCDGNAVAAVSEGTAGYSYSWTNNVALEVSTGTLADNLCAGTYDLLITDNNLCTVTTAITITEPAALSVTLAVTTVSCYNGTDGAVTSSVLGGTTPYLYQWNNIRTTADIAGLAANTYTVTVTDGEGCSITATETLINPAELIISTTSTLAGCGLPDGSASVSILQGSGPFNYQWAVIAGSQTTGTATGLAAGNYAITVGDNNNCPVTDVASVGNPNAPQLDVLTLTSVTCNGGTTGFAQVQVLGGTLPYVYQWTDAVDNSIGQTAASVTGLSVGVYQTTMTDDNNCKATMSVEILEPTLLETSLTGVADISCFGYNDGQGGVIAFGGTTPYSYSWNDGQTTATATGLFPTTGAPYTVVVTDDNGCTTTADVTISEPAQLILSSTVTDAYCQTPSGNIQVAVINGGVTSLGYVWSNGQGAGTAANLVPATYSLTVTDDDGCFVTLTETVNDIPAGVASIANSTDVSCFGGNDGTATVSMAGGETPLTYLWSNGLQTTTTVTGLIANTAYTVSVTDGNNLCTVVTNVIVKEPELLAVTLTPSPTKCASSSDGEVQAYVTGGTTIYSYLWNDNLAQQTSVVSGIPIGDYTVTVTDGKGCIIIETANVSEPSPLLLDTIVVNSHCLLSDGQVCVQATGGISNVYDYLWQTGAVINCVPTLPAGAYNVTVTDENGCYKTIAAIVTDEAGPSISITTMTLPLCNGNSDGDMTAVGDGGTGVLTYEWFDISGIPSVSLAQTLPTAFNLSQGTYSVEVTDVPGCKASASAVLGQPTPLVYNPTFDNPICTGYTDGTATVTADGGTTPYSIVWGDLQTGPTATGLAANTYVATLEDANGCSEIINITLTDPPQVTAIVTVTDAQCYEVCDGTATVTPQVGVSPFTVLWSDPNGQTLETASNLCDGSYTVTITDKNGCMAQRTTIIGQPTLLEVSIASFENLSCFENCDGFVQGGQQGGTAPYTYDWTGGQTTQIATGLCIGDYTSLVTDAQGCQATALQAITQPSPFVAVIQNSGPVTCFDACDGWAKVSASGGNGLQYTYQWDVNGNFSQADSTYNLCANSSIMVTVTDETGECTTTTVVDITEPPALVMSASPIEPHCGFADGEICVNVGGGTGAGTYTYNWSNNSGTPLPNGSCASNITAGCYNIDIFDANACISDSIFCVSDIDGPKIEYDGHQNVSCAGGNDGYIDFDVTDGTGQSTFTWYNSDFVELPLHDGLELAFNLTGGVYTLEVEDAVGCKAFLAQYVYVPDSVISAVTSHTNVACFGGAGGTAIVAAGGGTPGYTYSWSTVPTQAGLEATGLLAGVYTVTVVDDNGCMDHTPAKIEIMQPDQLMATAFPQDVDCFGGSDGVIDLTTLGGTAPYRFNWNPNTFSNPSPSAANLSAGEYHVTIIDANTCTATTVGTVGTPQAILADINPTDAFCTGFNGSATVDNLVGGTGDFTIYWDDPNAQVGETAYNLYTDAYSASIYDENGCNLVLSVEVEDQPAPMIIGIDVIEPSCNGLFDGSATVNTIGGTPVITPVWSDILGQTTLTAVGLSAGNYFVIVTDINGCAAVEGKRINEPSKFNANPYVSDTTICAGQTVEIWGTPSGGTGPYPIIGSDAITWTGDAPGLVGYGPHYLTPEPNTTNNYFFTVYDANDCSAEGSMTVEVREELTIGLIDPAETCLGIAVPITAEGSGGLSIDNWVFTWSNEFTSDSAATSTQTVNETGTTQYRVILSDGGCSQPDTTIVDIVVHPIPTSNFSATEKEGCPPFTTDFISSSSIDSSSFAWDMHGNGTMDTTVDIFEWTYYDSGIFDVILTVTSPEGCESVSEIEEYITVYPSPIADFTLDPAETTELNPIISTDGSFTIGADSLMEWNFGDGSLPTTGEFSEHHYADTGYYDVTLSVWNDYSCFDVDTQRVRIKPEFILYAPNAFIVSSAFDENRTFMPKGKAIDPNNFEMIIFDRWGDEVFKTNNPKIGWDGRINGSDKVGPEGVYIWKIVTGDIIGNEMHPYSGHVTLLK